MKCILCDHETGSSQQFTVAEEAQAEIIRLFPMLMLDEGAEEIGICTGCAKLPLSKRKQRAARTMARSKTELRREMIEGELVLSRNRHAVHI